jgi:hypothetical protein
MSAVSDFQPNEYGPVFAALVNRDRRRPLGGGAPAASDAAALEAASLEALFAHTSVVDEAMARCCLSAVWLLCDFLDESHTISQGISTQSGSFWHGIMHRREGDFSNAKYWFRKVGEHPVYELLAAAAGEDSWDPFDFVDACEEAIRSGGAGGEQCRELQQAEWELLFDHCYQAAVKSQ